MARNQRRIDMRELKGSCVRGLKGRRGEVGRVARRALGDAEVIDVEVLRSERDECKQRGGKRREIRAAYRAGNANAVFEDSQVVASIATNRNVSPRVERYRAKGIKNIADAILVNNNVSGARNRNANGPTAPAGAVISRNGNAAPKINDVNPEVDTKLAGEIKISGL